MHVVLSLSLCCAGEYQKLVQAYADDAALFDDAFAHAWYERTRRGAVSVAQQ